MIPDEKEIREYAKYAAKVREIVQEVIGAEYGRIDPYLLNELSKSATMPIGIWMNYRYDESAKGEELSSEELKKKITVLSEKFELAESNGYIRPRRNLAYAEFQSLKNEMVPLGYHYKLGKGFTKS
jgi:methyl coenzyme M reductase subunit D